MRADPAAHGGNGEPEGQNQSRVRVNHQNRDQPDDSEHRHGHPGERVAGLQRPVLLDITQKAGDEHNRGQMRELKYKNR